MERNPQAGNPMNKIDNMIEKIQDANEAIARWEERGDDFMVKAVKKERAAYRGHLSRLYKAQNQDSFFNSFCK